MPRWLWSGLIPLWIFETALVYWTQKYYQAIVIPLFSDHRILSQVAGHGVDIIKLIPPLVLSESDVGRFLEAFEDVVEKSHHFPGPIWQVTTRLAKHALKR